MVTFLIAGHKFHEFVLVKEKQVCQKWDTVGPHWYTYRLPKIFVSDLDVDEQFYFSNSWSSVILWSRVDIVLGQYAVPLICTIKSYPH